MRLTAWQATTFLVGEFQLTETEDHPVFTVADGLVWLYQSLDRNSMVRKMQVMKMRGQGAHSRSAYVSHHRPRHSGVSPTHSRPR